MQEQGCYIKKNSFHELHVSNGKRLQKLKQRELGK